MIFIHSFCKRSALALAIAGSLGLHGCATLPGQEPQHRCPVWPGW